MADGGSDDTADGARAEGAVVLFSPRGVGKGGAVEAGLRVVDGDLVLLVDGDMGTSAAGAAALLGPVMAGEADLVIGAPAGPAGGGFGLVRRLAAGRSRGCAAPGGGAAVGATGGDPGGAPGLPPLRRRASASNRP